MKKILTVLSTCAIIALSSSIVIASTLEYLQQLKSTKPLTYAAFVNGESFPSDGDQSLIQKIGDNETPIFWHFIDPSKSGFEATVVFSDVNGKIYTIEHLQSYKENQHYGVITPENFKIEDAWLEVTTEETNKQFKFVLSHVATTPTTQESTTQESTTQESTTQESTTIESTTQESTTQESTTQESTTVESTTVQINTTPTQTSGKSSESTFTTSPSIEVVGTDFEIPNTGENDNYAFKVIGFILILLSGAIATWSKKIKKFDTN